MRRLLPLAALQLVGCDLPTASESKGACQHLRRYDWAHLKYSELDFTVAAFSSDERYAVLVLRDAPDGASWTAPCGFLEKVQ